MKIRHDRSTIFQLGKISDILEALIVNQNVSGVVTIQPAIDLEAGFGEMNN